MFSSEPGALRDLLSEVVTHALQRIFDDRFGIAGLQLRDQPEGGSDDGQVARGRPPGQALELDTLEHVDRLLAVDGRVAEQLLDQLANAIAKWVDRRPRADRVVQLGNAEAKLASALPVQDQHLVRALAQHHTLLRQMVDQLCNESPGRPRSYT